MNKGQIQGDPMEVETHGMSGFKAGGEGGTKAVTATDLGMQSHKTRGMTVLRAKCILSPPL